MLLTRTHTRTHTHTEQPLKVWFLYSDFKTSKFIKISISKIWPPKQYFFYHILVRESKKIPEKCGVTWFMYRCFQLKKTTKNRKQKLPAYPTVQQLSELKILHEMLQRCWKYFLLNQYAWNIKVTWQTICFNSIYSCK